MFGNKKLIESPWTILFNIKERHFNDDWRQNEFLIKEKSSRGTNVSIESFVNNLCLTIISNIVTSNNE